MRQWLSVSSRMRRLVALSSTTSTRTPRTRAPGAGRAGDAGPCAKRASKWKRLPRPGSLSTSSRPPIAPTIRDAIASPRPVPPYSRVVEPSACANASKISRCFSGGMPMPVSLTEKASVDASLRPARRLATSTSTSPAAVNLIALPTRLTITCRSRAASPTTSGGTSGATRETSSSPFWCARTPRVRSVSPMSSRRSNGSGHEVEPAGLDAREVQQVVDQAEQRLGRVLERRQVLALHAPQRRVEQQLRHADHRVHRRADLVAHVGEEVALGAARGLGRLARLLQLLRGLLLLRHVAGDRVDQPLLDERRRLPRQPAVGAVRPAIAVLEQQRALAGRVALGFLGGGVAVVGMDELDVGPAHQLLERVAERFLPGGVQPAEVAVEARDAQHVARHLEERAELALGALPLHELPDLAAHGREQVEQALVGLAHVAAEELEHAEHVAAEHDREAEGAVQPLARRHGRAREVGVARDVLDPGRPAAFPDPSRQSDPARERRASRDGVELGQGDRAAGARSRGSGSRPARGRPSRRRRDRRRGSRPAPAGCAARPSPAKRTRPAREPSRTGRAVGGSRRTARECSWALLGPDHVGGDVTPRAPGI